VIVNIQQHDAKCKRRIKSRLDKTKFEDSSPVLSGANIHYEVSERTRAIAAGGIGMIHKMVGRLGLDGTINRSVNLFKIYLPYSESDHVLNIAYNIVAGGTCLDHLELRRNDEVYLDALGVQRIPDVISVDGSPRSTSTVSKKSSTKRVPRSGNSSPIRSSRRP